MKNTWNTIDIVRLFNIGGKIQSTNTLKYAESQGKIPSCKNIKKGTRIYREWTIDQIPEIGKHYGFIQKPKRQMIVSFYTNKGGTLKSSLSYHFSRISSLNGLKTLVIGLDCQQSITDAFKARENNKQTKENIEDKHIQDFLGEQNPSLYEFMFPRSKKNIIRLDDIIVKTDIPTLHYIPETPSLASLAREIEIGSFKEHQFSKRLIPSLKKYDLIVFDNSPSLSTLSVNSFCIGSNDVDKHIVSPFGCDLNSFRALESHIQYTHDFVSSDSCKSFTIVPTRLKARSTLSESVKSMYLAKHGNIVTSSSIRDSVDGDASTFLGITPCEYKMNSALSQDTINVVYELYKKFERGNKYGS